MKKRTTYEVGTRHNGYQKIDDLCCLTDIAKTPAEFNDEVIGVIVYYDGEAVGRLFLPFVRNAIYK